MAQQPARMIRCAKQGRADAVPFNGKNQGTADQSQAGGLQNPGDGCPERNFDAALDRFRATTRAIDDSNAARKRAELNANTPGRRRPIPRRCLAEQRVRRHGWISGSESRQAESTTTTRSLGKPDGPHRAGCDRLTSCRLGAGKRLSPGTPDGARAGQRWKTRSCSPGKAAIPDSSSPAT